jgi:hypothetical protein
MYDEFDEADRKRPRTWQIVVLALGAGLLVIGGAAAVINHQRVNRANGYAVKYGAAASTGQATITSRCVGEMRHEYDTTSDPRAAAIPSRVLAVLAPKICALGVSEHAVRKDGSMSEAAGYRLTKEIAQRMGVSRFQTLIYNTAAVDTYHLARPGHVSRWDRCVAMGYREYDSQTAKVKNYYRSRTHFFQSIRRMCTVGIARGLIPASGAPTRQEMTILLRETLAASS